MRSPESPEQVEPLVDVSQCGAVDRVQPPLAVRAYGCKPVVPQHLQMLGYRGLADRELSLDGCTHGTGRLFSFGEQFEYAPANRVAEDIERVHKPNAKSSNLYKSSLLLRPVQAGQPTPEADCTTSSRTCWLADCQDTAAG
jgi:hypothetical protein